VKKLEEKV